MKNQLALFLLFVLIIFTSNTFCEENQVSKTATPAFNRFVNVEEYNLREGYTVTKSSSYTNYFDVMKLDNDANNYCLPIYNTSRFNTRRLTKTINNFKYSTELEMYFAQSQNHVWRVVVFDEDIESGTASYPTLKEICDHGYYNDTIDTKYLDIRIQCNVREFLKTDIIAICMSPYSTYMNIPAQNFLTRAEGYVKK